MARAKSSPSSSQSSATIGFEAKLWLASNQSGEGDIRRALIEADLVDCMVALSS
jgi:type I restriction-modification system DNA methylase subunit